jgi:hypothetical protein
MIDKPPKPQGEEPRSEPEVIPPGQAEQDTPRMRVFVDTHSTERVYIGKPSLLGIILVTLIMGLLSAVLMVLLFGALLVALPAVVLLVTAAILTGLLRVYFQRAP